MLLFNFHQNCGITLKGRDFGKQKWRKISNISIIFFSGRIKELILYGGGNGIEINKKITERRSGDPAILVASFDKMKKDLGWSPEYTDIEKIIQTA